MEVTLLENQILIMKVLLSLTDNNELIIQLRKQISFTETLINTFRC